MAYISSLLAAASDPSGVNESTQLYALIALGVITCGLLLASFIRMFIRSSQKKSSNNSQALKHSGGGAVSAVLYCVTLFVLLVFALCAYTYFNGPTGGPLPAETQMPALTKPAASPTAAQTTPPSDTVPTSEATEATVPSETAAQPAAPDPLLSFHPHHTESSDPANWDIKWEISVDGEVTDSYTRESPIFFGEPETYYVYPGVSTFRGNNFRNDPTYGTVDISEGSLTQMWKIANRSLNGWPGCGWTGQPLIRKWDQATKSIMNMYDSKKEKEDLVEVIYATLDGYVYFLDLEDGSYTRNPVNVGMNMKGSGSLDPRGYPLLYVGSGDNLNGAKPRMYVISLIDGKILYQYGNNDSFAKRSWSGFDSAPLVAAEADTLIWPGENGVLYTIKLNTNYDQAAGTISVDPDTPVKAHYSTNRSNNSRYWVGMEDSACVVGQYLYVADNGGMFFCVDLNTMELIWAQDTKDDNNATPVFEWGEDGNGYLYTAPSLHWTAKNSWGEVSVYKLDAQTGEIIWERPFKCGTVKDVSGGVQSTPILGREGTDMDGMIIYSVSRMPTMSDGFLFAMDKNTGETIWELDMDSYSWCSPAAVYTADNKGYILMPSFTGTLYLLEGATGEVLDTFKLGSHMESSPVVYENTVVIGTRGSRIYGLKLN